jgi:hypothetical protein
MSVRVHWAYQASPNSSARTHVGRLIMGKPGQGSRTGPASIRAVRDVRRPPAGVWLLATVSGEVGGKLSVTQEFGAALVHLPAPGRSFRQPGSHAFR